MEYIELIDERKNIIESTISCDEIETNYSDDVLVNDDIDEISNTDLNNTNVIKNISYDQSEILYNIMQLYNNGEAFECDMTASELKFYGKKKNNKYDIPLPKILFDVYPMNETITKITPFQKLPLEDNSIKSIVVDLPFVISPHNAPSSKNPKKGSNLIQQRFSSWYPYMEAYENIFWWIKECNRVIDENGIIVWKMQNTISGSIEHSFEEYSFICGQHFGLYIIDEFILEAKARLISASKIKKQQHARKYTSKFIVFKKDKKATDKANCLKILNECINNNLEGKVWEVK